MTATADEEERAWATRLARAFLAPPAVAAGDEEPGPTVMLAVAVVPVAVPVPADRARGARRAATEEDAQAVEEEGP